jgi:uncharacterized protein
VSRLNRRAFLRLIASGTALAVGGASGGGTVYAGFTSAHRFDISRHALKLVGLKKPVRVAQLTDFHYGNDHGLNELMTWINAAMLEKPDLILLTGDLLDTWVEPEVLDALVPVLAKLKAPLGVFAVVGNHDFFRFYDPKLDQVMLGSKAVQSRLERAGIHVLVNDGVRVRDDLFLAGVDDLWEGKPDAARALRGASAKGATLLMSHNPDLLPDVPETVGLTLCGHTHGGQVRVPGLPFTFYSVSKYGERFQQGFVRGGADGRSGAMGFVSRGLGTSGIPMRLFCPAELVVLNLEPA